MLKIVFLFKKNTSCQPWLLGLALSSTERGVTSRAGHLTSPASPPPPHECDWRRAPVVVFLPAGRLGVHEDVVTALAKFDQHGVGPELPDGCPHIPLAL